MIDSAETLKNFFWRLLQISSKHGVAFLIFFISASYLSEESFGQFVYYLAVASLLVLFCDFGLGNSAAIYVAEFKARNKSAEINKLFSSVALVIIFISAVFSAAIFFAGKVWFPKDLPYILLLIPYLFFLPLTSLLDGVYRGLMKFKLLSLISGIVGFVSLLLALFLVRTYGISGAIMSHNILYGLSFVLLTLFLKEKSFSFDWAIVKKVFNYGVVIGIISIMYYIYTKADIIVLKHFGYVEEIGYYEVLNQIFILLLVPFIIFGQVLGPDITKMYALKKYDDVKSNFEKLFLIIVPSAIILTAILYFLIPIIIDLLFSKYFNESTLLMLKVLLLILPLKMLSTIVNFAHTVPTENAHFSMWTMIPAAALNIVLDILFIKEFGFIGVVYATVISHTLAMVAFMTLYYRKLRRITLEQSQRDSL